MKEFTIIFNEFDCFKYFRTGISEFIKDHITHDPTLVEIALNEAVNNAVKHAENKKVHVKLKVQKNGKLVIRVMDKGKGFVVHETLNKVNELNTKENREQVNMNESGRGLFIMHQVMDKVFYNRKGNDVILVKNPNSQSQDSNELRVHCP